MIRIKIKATSDELCHYSLLGVFQGDILIENEAVINAEEDGGNYVFEGSDDERNHLKLEIPKNLTESPFVYEIGQTYETQEGKMVKVLGRTDVIGYECLHCSDCISRYDRSISNTDAGRVTGTPHDYSCPNNFKR